LEGEEIKRRGRIKEGIPFSTGGGLRRGLPS